MTKERPTGQVPEREHPLEPESAERPAGTVRRTPAAECNWRSEVLRAFHPGPTDVEDQETVEEMLAIIAAGRTRKAPVDLLAQQAQRNSGAV